MKRSLSVSILASLAFLALAQDAAAQARFVRVGGVAGGVPGGAAGGYPAEPLVVLPYASGGSGMYGQQQPQVQQPLPPNVIEQQEDQQEQQAPSLLLNDPDDSALEQPPMDDPQDASGFDGLQSIDNVDSSY